jgi:hypothetical protein
MVTLLTWSVVGYWFETLSGQRHKIGICYFSAAVLRSKRKDWLTQNQEPSIKCSFIFTYFI